MARSDYTFKMVNNKRVDLTDSEIDACVARDEEWAKGAADRAWASIRQERDSRLAATDYFALSDVTMSTAMESYRASLRSLPQDTANAVAFQTQWDEFSSGKDGVSDPWPTKP